MKDFLLFMLVFVMAFTGTALFAKPPNREHSLKKTSLKKERPPLASLKVVLKKEKSQEADEKTIAIPWPMLPKGTSEIRNISFEITSTTPNSKNPPSFSVPDLSSVWKKSNSLPVSVRFTVPKDASLDPKPHYEAAISFFGYREDNHERVELLRGRLVAEVVFPTKLSCKALYDDWGGTPTAPTVEVKYSCINLGKTPVTVTGFRQTCDSALPAWSFPTSISIHPFQDQTFTGSVTLPNSIYKNYSCHLSFLANGMEAATDSLSVQVRMGTSVFLLSKQSGAGTLALQKDGTYHVKFYATPPNEQDALTLQIKPLPDNKIIKIHVLFQKDSLFQHQPTEQKDELVLRFSPKQAATLQEKATVAIDYEANKILHSEQIAFLLEGSVQVVNRTVLRSQWVDIEPARKQSEAYRSIDFVPPDAQKDLRFLPVPQWFTWQGTHPIFHKSSESIHRIYNPEEFGPAKARWRVAPPTVQGAVDVFWREKKNPYVLNQWSIPTTVRYRREPFGLLVNAQIDPGVTLERNRWLGFRLDLMKQWVFSFNPNLLTRDLGNGPRRLMLRIGLSWMMGGILAPSSVLAQKDWNASIMLIPNVEFGGDITDSQRVSLFGHLGFGWKYEEEKYLQQKDRYHDNYLNIGARLQFRLLQKLPGLYLTAGVMLGVSYAHKFTVQAEVPIGIGFQF